MRHKTVNVKAEVHVVHDSIATPFTLWTFKTPLTNYLTFDMTGPPCRLLMTVSVCVCVWAGKRKRGRASVKVGIGADFLEPVPTWLPVSGRTNLVSLMSRWCDKSGRESKRGRWSEERWEVLEGAKVWVISEGGWKKETKEREIRGREREKKKKRESRESCPEVSFLCLHSVQRGQQQCHTQLKTFTGSQEAHLDFS